jgi:hypothetical protein
MLRFIRSRPAHHVGRCTGNKTHLRNNDRQVPRHYKLVLSSCIPVLLIVLLTRTIYGGVAPKSPPNGVPFRHRNRSILNRSGRAAWFFTEISHAEVWDHSPKLFSIETKFNGLGAQALRLIDAIAFAKLTDARLSVVRLHYWNYGCGSGRTWDCYFLAPWLSRGVPAKSGVLDISQKVHETCEELSVLASTGLMRGVCAIISTGASEVMTAAALQRLDYPASLLAARAIGQGIWHHNKETQKRVDALCEKAGLGQKGVTRYVGVHVRRGDKVKEVPNVPLPTFLKAIDAVAPPEMPVFIASDDGATIRAFKAITRRQVLALPSAVHRIGHVQQITNRIAPKAKADVVDELFAEMHALVRAEWFVGTFSSNMGRLVHVLRSQSPETSISLDDRWAPGVAFYTFGQPYCEWEGANRLYCATIKNEKQEHSSV